jgi:hypothetical protein
MNVDEIPLGGEWFHGRRQFAPGLSGHVDMIGPEAAEYSLAAEITAEESIHGTLRQRGRVYFTNDAPKATLLKLAANACDRAARVFLAGCLGYAEWVRDHAPE